MSETLSVCIIARDEEKSIEKCIKSIVDIADEIIVLDTGSVDDTVNLAESLGAKVYQYIWNNDYSEARNNALEYCTMDWIFIIDADEVLEIGYGELLKKLIDKTKKDAIYMAIRNMIGTQIVNEELKLRVFKNRKEYRYINKFNEEVFTAIKKVAGISSFETSDFIITHYGLDENIVDAKWKFKRNKDVLNSYLGVEKNTSYYVGLGNIYVKENRNEAAIELFEKSLKLGEKKNPLRVHAIVGICNCYYKLKKYITSINLIDKYLKEYPSLKELHFLKSACNNELMRYSRSFIALNMFKAIPTNIKKYPTFNFGLFNDIDSLVLILGALRVPHALNLLTVIIEVNNKLSQYEDAIKNVNEISEDVIVVNVSGDDEIREKAHELGAVTYSYPNKEREEWEYKISKKAKGKWILYLEQNRVINYEERPEIIKLIEECNKNNIKEMNLKYRLIKKNSLEK